MAGCVFPVVITGGDANEGDRGGRAEVIREERLVVAVLSVVVVTVVEDVEGLSSLALEVLTVSIGRISSNAFMNAGRTDEPEEDVEEEGVVVHDNRDEGVDDEDEDGGEEEEGEGVGVN